MAAEWDEKRRIEHREWSARHEERLNRQDWHMIRKHVFDRDGYVCQGCLKNEAEVCHHITYDNEGSEFCFELISLCRDCHDRIHRRGKYEQK